MRTSDPLRQNEGILNLVSRVLDCVFIALSGVFAHAVFFRSLDLDSNYRSAILFAAVLTLILFPFYDNYGSWRGRTWFEHFRVVLVSVATVMVALVVVSAMNKSTSYYSRAWFAMWSGCAFTSIFIYKRLLIRGLKHLRKKGWNKKRLAIVGAGSLGQTVADHLKSADWSGFEVVAFIDDQAPTDLKIYSGVPILRVGSGQIENAIASLDIQEIWLALPLKEEDRMREILHDLRHSTAAMRFVPDVFSLKLLFGHAVSSVVGVPVLDINTSPISGLNLVVKEIEDRVLSLLILILISPLMLLIAIAIRIESRGPSIFKQERHGWDGRIIKVYKFRSMFVHEEHEGQVTQATKGDSRITRVGAFLRSTSLDELPQFFNVLQGRMSIVGPRPHAVVHNEYYKDKVDFYFQRHKVKPGITGWAQINGYRGETDTLEKMEKRIELDLEYIRNWSLWMDIKIIALTVFKGFVSRQAY